LLVKLFNINYQEILSPYKKKGIKTRRTYDFKRAIKNIASVLNTHGLTPFVSPEKYINLTKGHKHRYFSPCLNKSGKRVFFYYLLRSDPLSVSSFKKEVDFAKKLKEQPLKDNNCFPHYLAYCENPYYLITQYEDGYSLENKKKPGFVNSKIEKPPIKKIAQALCFVNFKLSSIMPITAISSQQLQLNFLLEKIELLISNKKLNPRLKSSLSAFLQNNIHLSAENNKYFSHHDFYLGNIILNDKRLVIIDWETYQKDTFTYDLATLVCRSYGAVRIITNIVNEYYSLLSSNNRHLFYTLLKLDIIRYLLVKGLPSSFYEMNQEEISKQCQWFYQLLDYAVSLDNKGLCLK
jgi:thiamine kinase-like enzyme